MAHSVGEQAARAVKNSQKKTLETRTPEEILKVIRGNIAAKLFVTPTDQKFLLEQYDASQADFAWLGEKTRQYMAEIQTQAARIQELEGKLLEFREVYEQENRSASLRVDVLASASPEAAL